VLEKLVRISVLCVVFFFPFLVEPYTLLGRRLRFSADERWNSKGWVIKKRSACTSYRSLQQLPGRSFYSAHPICSFWSCPSHAGGRNNPVYPSEAWKSPQTSYHIFNACRFYTRQRRWPIDAVACLNFCAAKSVWTVTLILDSDLEHQLTATESE